ncbi:M61 family metallopeptidase [Kinneretia aquatilis]|uniref:M61 family metallopeptidase n=1 Tax=Kinneretia aquatilis TaxID=2070761 RepID=UPI0014952474|nr:M61 family metallopeptidase [Paucibacter aquatile]WIV98399.1 M61 family metallopeptidase [Paucibacter aquatile]
MSRRLFSSTPALRWASFSGRTRAATAAVLLALASIGPAQAQHPIPQPEDKPYLGPIRIQVDATDLDRHIFQVRQQLPVKPGRLTLLFPRYLPGAHGPYGTVDRLAGLKIHAGTQELAWLRDTVDPFAFHVEVPAGVNELNLAFQFLSPVQREGGRVVMTPEMLNLQWISMLLYPAGHHASALQMQAEVTLPAGWTQASALRVESQSADGPKRQRLRFKPVSLETLADSPLFAGAHTRRIELDPPGHPKPVVLNLMADDPAELQASEAQIQAHKNLVVQADRLFASRHFKHYDFLLAISGRMSGIGLEHHESSENGVGLGYFKDWGKRAGSRSLLPHEYTHSWNGKFRRPADLWTPQYNVPMQDSLLWLYEGQTDYWGRVLAVRSGLVSPEQARDAWAEIAATYSHRAGRLWRNLQDTTNEAAMAKSRSGHDWNNWQRGADYYAESGLIWLDADTWIREQSGGARSLDDFARLFFGVEDGRIAPLTYTFEDIVATLNRVQPRDWAAFLRQRLDHKGPEAPLDGLARAGWRLSWAETPSEFARADDSEWKNDDFAYSLGLNLKRDGKVEAVLWGSPAFEAGLSRAVTVVAVNNQAYKSERLAAAISANKGGAAPLELLLREGDRFRQVKIDYRGGLRYPRLSRVEGSPERLDSGVLAARP